MTGTGFTKSKGVLVDREFIEKRAAEVLLGYGVTSAYLFGSWADGTARDDSDIDIAVEGLAAGRYFDVLAALIDEFKRDVDLVRVERVPATMAERIRRNGARLAA